jgi:hypothetical protein
MNRFKYSGARVGSDQVQNRVARFFWVHDTKTGKNVTNEHKRYQMVITYPKWPYNIPNGRKIYQHFPM